MSIGIGNLFQDAQKQIEDATKGFAPIPEAKYLCRIEKAEYKTFDSGSECLELRVRILDPALDGRNLFGKIFRVGKGGDTKNTGRFFKTLLDLGLSNSFFATPDLSWDHVAAATVGRFTQVSSKNELGNDGITRSIANWFNAVPAALVNQTMQWSAAKPMEGATAAQATAGFQIPATADTTPAAPAVAPQTAAAAPAGGMAFNPTI